MLKKIFKNYFSNLKYALTVLGVLFLALLIGVSVLYGGLGTVFRNTVSTMKTSVADAGISADRILNSFSFEATESISDAFNGTINQINDLVEKLKADAQGGVYSAIIVAVIFAAIQLLGIVVSHDSLYFRLRKKNGTPGKFVSWLLLLLRGIIFLALAGTGVYLALDEATRTAGIIILCITPFIQLFIMLLFEWWGAGKERPAFVSVINFKNYFSVLLSVLLYFILSAAISALIILVFGYLTGFYVVEILLILSIILLSLDIHYTVVNK